MSLHNDKEKILNILGESPDKTGWRVLVITSVPAEKDAIVRGLNGAEQFDVLVSGVGVAAAAARTASALLTNKYDVVISAGIAGGFVNRADVGSLVVADEIVAADLGAETPEGFSSLDELGFGSARVSVDERLAKRVTKALQVSGLHVCTGSVLTVSTVTGTDATAIELTKRVEGAMAEAMEGYGVAVATREHQLPVLEIRAISNPVGPRERGSWQIKEALHQLQLSSSILAEVFT